MRERDGVRVMKIIIHFYYKFALALRRKILALLDASTVGVRAIVLNHKKEVLLVKHTYNDDRWYLPGGSIEKHETPLAAIIRELQEETGVHAIDNPRLINIYCHKISNVTDYPILYLVDKFQQIESYSPEIAESGWFAFTNLPHDTSPATVKRLAEFFLDHSNDGYWR